MEVKIVPVTSKSGIKKFIKSQWKFYSGDKNFVPPLIYDRLKVLDTQKNPFFKHAEMQLFLAENGGEIVGRIAAIVNYNHNKTHNDKVGFFGFFECIDNQQVANALFDAASAWVKEKGMDTMRGPENPSMNDEIGLLIDGFEAPPVMMMTYNPKYYIKLIENYGFTKAKDVYAYIMEHDYYAGDKMVRLQNIIKERYKVKIRTANFGNKEQFKKDVQAIKDIYNAAWQPNWGFVKWTEEEFDYIAGDLKQIADERLVLFAESDGKLAGFALALPDINESLIHNKNGGLIGGLWHLMTKKKKITTCRIIALGVLPEFQKSGIDAVLYYEIGERAHDINIDRGEASWILEDNTMMNRGLTTTIQAHIYKTYRLYDKSL